MSAPPPRRLEPAAGAGALGMKLLVISLAVLFASALASFWVIRGNDAHWQGTADDFRVPLASWFATALLAGLSAATERARRRLGAGAGGAASGLGALRLGLAFAVLFLLAQALSWRALIAAHLPPGARSLYAFSFYLLTGLHALHVLGGLIFHGLVLRRAAAGGYTGAAADGPRNLAIYWHFLGLTWLALLATLVLGADPALHGAAIVRGCLGLAAAAAAAFVACWLRVELSLLRHEGPLAALIGLFPPVAFLRGFMRADEFRLRAWLFWWTAAFGVALAAGATGLAVSLGTAGS